MVSLRRRKLLGLCSGKLLIEMCFILHNQYAFIDSNEYELSLCIVYLGSVCLSELRVLLIKQV